jgi:hypothetical protein
MQRINDNTNQKIDELQKTVRDMALQTNQLVRLLDGKDINEVNFLNGQTAQRTTRFSLANGLLRSDWIDISDVIGGGGGTTSYADYLFGFTTPTTEVVAVNAGELQDSALAVKTVATANITVTGATTYFIYVQYAFGGTPTIEGSLTRPTVDATTFRVILHTWTLVGTKATLSKIYHTGAIIIPGTFATQT